MLSPRPGVAVGEAREAVQAGRQLNVDTPKQLCNMSLESDIGSAGVNPNA